MLRVAAIVGATVFVGMGALGVAFDDTAAAGASMPAPTGQTITKTTAPSEPETPFARPTVLAPTFKPKIGTPQVS